VRESEDKESVTDLAEDREYTEYCILAEYSVEQEVGELVTDLAEDRGYTLVWPLSRPLVGPGSEPLSETLSERRTEMRQGPIQGLCCALAMEDSWPTQRLSFHETPSSPLGDV